MKQPEHEVFETTEEEAESQEHTDERELTSEEVRWYLQTMIERYTQISKGMGMNIVFPDNTPEIAHLGNVAGLSIQDVLARLAGMTQEYEPHGEVEAEQTSEQQKNSGLPAWLEGHESLIWRGELKNEPWKVTPTQYDDRVYISYTRRNQTIKPGKPDAAHTTEPLRQNSFTVSEWRVVSEALKEYEKTEQDLASQHQEVRKATKDKIRTILGTIRRNENGEPEHPQATAPQVFEEAIARAMQKVTQRQRGFGQQENLNTEKLKQAAAEIVSQLFVLNRHRQPPNVPEINPDIKEIPSFEQSLRRFAEVMERQTQAKKGLTLLMGEAGTGKNELVKRYAAATKRPFYWFPCGRGMDAMDLAFHYEFDSKEGTKRFFTSLSEGISTPGAVVMVDEANALKPDVQAILHGLGDGSRTLKYDGISVAVAEGVQIVIAGNPATFGSAGNLGEALLDRSVDNAMPMLYPPLTKGELQARAEGWNQQELQVRCQTQNELNDLAADEILTMYPRFNEFAHLDDDEFSLLWDTVANEANQGAHISEALSSKKLKPLLEGASKEHIEKTLLDMACILRIADRWRKQYLDKGMQIGISMRGTEAVTNAYLRTRNVAKAYLEAFEIMGQQPIEGLNVDYTDLQQIISDIMGQYGHGR